MNVLDHKAMCYYFETVKPQNTQFNSYTGNSDKCFKSLITRAKTVNLLSNMLSGLVLIDGLGNPFSTKLSFKSILIHTEQTSQQSDIILCI